MTTKFWGRNLKIQHRTSFDLNGLKNGSAKYFKNSIKLLHFFQGLIWCRYILLGASKLTQIFLPDTRVYIHRVTEYRIPMGISKSTYKVMGVQWSVARWKALHTYVQDETDMSFSATSLKPNYFKKQCFSSSFLLTWSKYTSPKWPWSTQQASLKT